MQAEPAFETMEQSPHKLEELKSIAFSDRIVAIERYLIEEDLQQQYLSFKEQRGEESKCQQVLSHGNKALSTVITIVHELWREIIPAKFRGNMNRARNSQGRPHRKEEEQLFAEYKKRRCPFFLIVFETNYTEEEAELAFERASFVVAEGQGISQAEFKQKTNHHLWRVCNLLVFRKFTIHFFRFSCFGEMLWFGNLTHSFLTERDNMQSILEDFKKQLDEAFRLYDEIEREFLGSYAEKEDRRALE